MLCSKCGAVIKPVVAVDIDGTLGDYHTHFTEFCVDYWNLYPTWDDAWDGHGEFEDYLGISKEQYRQAKLAYRQGGMKRHLPLFKDSQWFMQNLMHLEVEIWVATTRPWQLVQNIDSDTQFWLTRSGFKIDGLLYGEDKYEQLVQHVDPARIVGVIDDLPDQLEKADKLGLPWWQVARTHNSNGPELLRRGTLTQAWQWLENNLKEWKGKTWD